MLVFLHFLLVSHIFGFCSRQSIFLSISSILCGNLENLSIKKIRYLLFLTLVGGGGHGGGLVTYTAPSPRTCYWRRAGSRYWGTSRYLNGRGGWRWVRSRDRKVENFLDSSIYLAKTFRTGKKCVNKIFAIKMYVNHNFAPKGWFNSRFICLSIWKPATKLSDSLF